MHKNEILNEKDNYIKLGNSQFDLANLRSVTMEEAIAGLTRPHCPEDRVRNAWKRANRKK